MQGADGLAALLAGLGFPQLQQARELQRLQQGQARPQGAANPAQAAGPGFRVEIGFGAGGQQQFVFPGAGPQFVQAQGQEAPEGEANVQVAGQPTLFGGVNVGFL
jgi:hypothetical protein